MDEGNIRQELLKVPRETATHVHKLLTKIATNPDEIKYRRLKTSSRLFRERFGDAGALLGALGFAADGDLCSREGADGVEAALRLVDARLAMSDGEVERARGPAPMETDDDDDDDLARALAMSREEAPPPPPEDEDSDGDGMAFDPALLQPATRWPGPTGGDSTDDDTPPSPAPARPTRAPKRPKKLDDAAPAPKKRARVSIDGPPARDPPGATAAAPGSIMATAQSQLSDTLYSKKQILEVMPNGQGSHVPAVYAAGGVIYALCFSEDSNPGLPTVVEISCGTQRKKQVQRRSNAQLFRFS